MNSTDPGNDGKCIWEQIGLILFVAGVMKQWQKFDLRLSRWSETSFFKLKAGPFFNLKTKLKLKAGPFFNLKIKIKTKLKLKAAPLQA